MSPVTGPLNLFSTWLGLPANLPTMNVDYSWVVWNVENSSLDIVQANLCTTTISGKGYPVDAQRSTFNEQKASQNAKSHRPLLPSSIEDFMAAVFPSDMLGFLAHQWSVNFVYVRSAASTIYILIYNLTHQKVDWQMYVVHDTHQSKSN